MDYPKSVPNVGLVGGKFVDENTGTGQVGSLIPAKWGTSITDELLNVIMGGGYVPDESNNAQLLAAIKEIIKFNTDAIPRAGGPYYPKLYGMSVNAEVRGYNGIGGYIGWGNDGSGTMQFVCNRGGGHTGGYSWWSVNADNQSLGPAMTYSPAGLLSVPSLAVSGSATVPTPEVNDNSKKIVNTEYLKSSLSQFPVRNWIDAIGLVGGDKSQPYMQHQSGDVVMLQPLKPKNTALLSPTGWKKDADTGEIVQWFEYVQGDVPGTAAVNISWPFQFPNQFLNARFTFKMPNSTTSCVTQVSYSAATISGCTVRLEEWGNAAQAGLVLVVEARGN